MELRIAWVFTNGNGNNLYLDNFEFFNASDQDIPRVDDELTVFPNPATDGKLNIVLNLVEPSDVAITLHDLFGNVVFDDRLSNALNQTYSYSVPALSGLYLLKIRGRNINISKKIISYGSRRLGITHSDLLHQVSLRVAQIGKSDKVSG